jgi:methyltransferase (TIGR00027 family)
MKTGQPSHTAVRIAANRMAAAREPRLAPLLLHADEPYSGWFVREFSPVFHFLWSWGPSRRFFYRTYERSTPGAALYLLLRKRWVEEQVRGALAGRPSLRQVAILGAGLDPLGLWLAADYPDLRIFELDHPETQQFKAEALRKHHALPAALRLQPVDLSLQSLDALLPRLEGYDPSTPSLWLAEGLLMYLDAREVDRVLAALARGTAPGSTALLTFVDAERLSDPESTVSRMRGAVEAMGEPLRSSVHRGELRGFLARHGWELEQVADVETLRAAYLPDRPGATLTDGELLVLARRR